MTGPVSAPTGPQIGTGDLLDLPVRIVHQKDAPREADVGLLIRHRHMQRSRLAVFTAANSTLTLRTVLPGGMVAISDPISAAMVGEAVAAQIDRSVAHVELPGGALPLLMGLQSLGLRNDSEIEGIRLIETLPAEWAESARGMIEAAIGAGMLDGSLERLRVGDLKPWWHLFDGSALELRVLLPPPLGRSALSNKLQLLLIGAAPRRAIVLPGEAGSVTVLDGSSAAPNELIDAVLAPLAHPSG